MSSIEDRNYLRNQILNLNEVLCIAGLVFPGQSDPLAFCKVHMLDTCDDERFIDEWASTRIGKKLTKILSNRFGKTN